MTGTAADFTDCPQESTMNTRTLLIILIIVLLLGGGGYYGQGRWF